MTKLYLFDREGETLPETLAERLPPWRRVRFERLKNEAVRQESLWAGLLYAFAMERDGRDPRSPVAILPAGKPTRPDVCFSLSHSGRYVLCAVGDGPVGADVQKRRDVSLTIARRFHPEERRWLESVPAEERQAALFRLWTRKEAWVKAVSGERMLSLSEADVIHGDTGLFFRDYDLPGGYAAAVCARDEAPPAAILSVSREELLTGIRA